MALLRRLSYATLALAVLQIVFGAVVRITDSGMGCGDHWPKCLGYWFPPLTRVDLVIEVAHRYIAAALMVAIVALTVTAFVRRDHIRVGGKGGVLRAAGLGLGLVLAAALLGAVTVKLGLHPLVVVAHLAIAMALLATLAVTAVRAGGFGADQVSGNGTRRTARGAAVAAALAFAVLVLGALTANLPGAASACQGFPLCSGSVMPRGAAGGVHMTHRVLALLLFAHVLGLTVALARRRESRVLIQSSRIALGAIVLQVIVAVLLVELALPPVLRSLHQAVGTLVWVAVFALAALAKRAASEVPAVATREAAEATPSAASSPAPAYRMP